MEWVYHKRRGQEWKQGWTGSGMASVSAPPLPLLVIFGIVISLLWLSQYKYYKAQLYNTALNLQLFLFLLPILLIFFMISYSTGGSMPQLSPPAFRAGVPSLTGAQLSWCCFLTNLHFIQWFGPLQTKQLLNVIKSLISIQV